MDCRDASALQNRHLGLVKYSTPSQIHLLISVLILELVGYVAFLITSKVLDVRRRGAMTEAYGVIRRKPAPAKAGGEAIEGDAALRLYSGP
jgi:hypothetical protein